MVDILFWALVVFVIGSMLGEWLGVNGYLGNQWFLFGHQGWEYLELGRIWQIGLVAGMAIWLFIVYRGIYNGLKKERDKGGLIHLLFLCVNCSSGILHFCILYPSGWKLYHVGLLALVGCPFMGRRYF